MILYDIILNKAKSGSFFTTYCNRCKLFFWPPNFYCKVCYKKTRFKLINKKGVLLETSFSNIVGIKGHYGIGEFSNIRILGTIDNNLKVSDRIRISHLLIKDKKVEIGFSKLRPKLK